jgi:heptaprenyl diphosphate synthase
MAFQLSDDILDIASDHEDSGKTPGTDLREGVRTLPVLYALESDVGDELAALLDGDLGDDEVARALELLRGSDALEQVARGRGGRLRRRRPPATSPGSVTARSSPR